MHGDDRDDLRIGSLGRTQGTNAIAPSDSIEGGVEGADAVASTGAVAGVAGDSEIGATERIAQSLASGAIDPAQAKAQLIDEIVRAQLPAGTDPATIEALRAEVTDLLADDPLLESLLRP